LMVTILLLAGVSSGIAKDKRVDGASTSPKSKAFEMWPPTNGAEPVPYTRAAPAIPEKTLPWKFPAGTGKVSVTVDVNTKLRVVTPYYFGGNVAWWNGKGWFNDPDRFEKARQSGIRFWRWPGGSSSDNYHWDNDYSWHVKDKDGGDPANMNRDWAVSSEDFIDFCRKTGSEAIVTANYGCARYGDVERAADLAARWVKWFNKEKKFKVRYWEVGNENYGPWEEGNKIEGKPQLTGEEYAKDFLVFSKAMKKADPDIHVGLVCVDIDDGNDWTGYRWWMKGALPVAAAKADYLILHQYFMWPFDNANNYTNPGMDLLLGNARKLGEAKAAVDAMVKKYVPELPETPPVALTEYNLINASPSVTIELVNALFTAKVLGESIRTGYVASNHWDWKNGLDGKLKGDHALLAGTDPDVPEAQPRPSYYAFALMTRTFGDTLVGAVSDDPGISVYASRFQGGEQGLVVINEKDRNTSVEVAWKGFAPKGDLMGWVVTGKSLDSKTVSWNGVEGPSGGGGPFPLDAIPPYRTKFDPARPLVLSVPAHSVCGVVVY